jgi:hypothetical protein
MWRTVVPLAFSAVIVSCGGGGGGGGGGSPPAAQATIVSGTVQAPGGQLAFNSPQGLLQQFAQFIAPSAYASVTGLSPVPDGTMVQLVRFNTTGTGFTVLSSLSISVRVFDVVATSNWPTGYHLRGAPLAPVPLSLSLLDPLGTPVTADTLRFLLEMCIGSPLLAREPTSFQTKEETRWLPTTKNPLTRCAAATSKRRFGRMSVKKDRSSRRPSHGPSRIDLAHGATGLPLVSMTWKLSSPLHMKQKSGLPLMS